MRFIICGAGQVGYSIASYLAGEENDVTVIDTDFTLISQINDNLDVNGIVGHASNPDVLNAAGASDADMIISVTQSDEVNMIACQIGHSLFGIPKKIARIREQAYLDPAWSNLFSRSHMPIDHIISPEVIIAQEIFNRLVVPGTTYVVPLAGGLAHVVGVVCRDDCPVVNTPIGQLKELFPDLSFEVLAILRQNKQIIPDYEDQLHVGDEVFFIVDTQHLKRTMVAFGHEEVQARRIIVAGGGNVGFGLTQMLCEKGHGMQIKLIESGKERSEFLSEQLENVIVLNGSTLDKDILEEAGVNSAEVMIAVTNDDETNILGSLLAKRYGCQRVITLVTNNAYSPLVGPLGVDALVSPRASIVATIMKHVRRGKIRNLHNIRDGFAEIIEAEVSDHSSIVNMSIRDLVLPHEILVAGIVREGAFMIPTADMVIKSGDDVIMLASREQAQSVERIFSVQVDLF